MIRYNKNYIPLKYRFNQLKSLNNLFVFDLPISIDKIELLID